MEARHRKHRKVNIRFLSIIIQLLITTLDEDSTSTHHTSGVSFLHANHQPIHSFSFDQSITAKQAVYQTLNNDEDAPTLCNNNVPPALSSTDSSSTAPAVQPYPWSHHSTDPQAVP